MAGDDLTSVPVLERPDALAVLGVDAVDPAAEIADDHDAIGHGRGGFRDRFLGLIFPAQFAVAQVNGMEFAGLIANVHSALGNSGGGLDGVPGLVGPEEFEGLRNRLCGNPGQEGVATELGPFGARSEEYCYG